MLEGLQRALRAQASPEKAVLLQRFFKTGPGQYGEGDRFLGLTVPTTRQTIRDFQNKLSLKEVRQLLHSPWHEERLAAVLILVAQYRAGSESKRQKIYQLYLDNSAWVNNWDLVDSSAHYIVGPWLDGRPDKLSMLNRLAKSSLVWDRRIAILATFDYIRQARADEALLIAELLLHDQHDLIQKAVGWMLREVGKRVDRQILLQFLDKHAATMPRTTLRYAIEHLDPQVRQAYLGKSSDNTLQ